MNENILRKKALKYHRLKEKPGKIEISLTKPSKTQADLSLAYTPGVAYPSLEIAKKKQNSYKYTNRGNLIAILSNGSAILGLGDLGPEAAYPVMEGKALLFKNYADIDAFPLCIHGRKNSQTYQTHPAKIIEFAKEIAPSVGGINLEDIKAPECFEIEEELTRKLDIPVFHDDQHGTAIITVAALINALKLTGKKIDKVKCVFSGAGAAGIATAKLFLAAGVKKKNLFLCDSKGVIYKGRKIGMNAYKKEFAISTKARSLKTALKNADVFIGVSRKNLLRPSMVKSMAKDPIIFAMANPWPEIMPDLARQSGAFIIGTGRSDFPNQINNVLGFPGLFRGLLDTRAKIINTEMKLAAAKALADLTEQAVPPKIKKHFKKAYPKDFKKGIFNAKNPLNQDYVIPKPLDPRVVPLVAQKVAKASIETKSARKKIASLKKYRESIEKRIQNL
ncbi:MAG: malate dehydrogenase [Candidatus Moranbacteria bacterium]|nr:malate dehydrogenase [Candidatus Moranbacteria bacterium]